MDYLFSEYASWKKENAFFYEELKEHETMLFDRFYPVYEVMNHIEKEVAAEKLKFDDDLKKIFDVGLAFLHEQFETCKIYLDTDFKKDLHAFLAYESIVNYILYIEDVRYELVEKNLEYDDQLVEELLDELEAIIDQRQEIAENFGLYVDEKVNRIIGDHSMDFYGIIDIFTDVAETLGLYLFEDDEIVIGKDI
jgi:translation elongation factor EF-G